MRKFLSASIITVVAFFIWIAVFELASTWYVDKFGDPLDKAKRVLIIDRYLGWRQKPDFQGRFLGNALMTNETGLRNKSFSRISNSSRNILVLGPSSTFGWGVEDYQAYPFLIEESLRKKYPGIDINVINAGEIGFSSWQGLELYKEKEFSGLKADVLIIAYGINDIDKYRFFYASLKPDKDEFAVPKKAWQVSVQNFLLKFNFINLLSRKILNWGERFSHPYKNIPIRRVSDEDFYRNIEGLIQMGESRGSKVILLSSAYYLPSAGKDAGTDAGDSDMYYNLSSRYSHRGDYKNARNMFEKARRLEPRRISADVERLNGILKRTADKNDVILVDINKALFGPARGSMFLDPVHFSVAGNERLAQALSGVIYRDDLLRINKKYQPND